MQELTKEEKLECLRICNDMHQFMVDRLAQLMPGINESDEFDRLMMKADYIVNKQIEAQKEADLQMELIRK